MKMFKPILLIGIAVISLTACKKSDTTFHPQVTNNPDNFTFQASNSTNLSSTYDYSWTNSGQAAQITVNSSVTTGTADVVIYDAANSQVYTGDIQTNGSFMTSTGTAGTWRIHVVLSGANGTVTFNVVKH